MELENYRQRDLTVSFWKANFYSLILLLPLTLLFIVYSFIWGKPKILFVYPYWLIYIVGIIVHESIHAIAAIITSKKGIKIIQFGISWKLLTPYCHIKEPLILKNYRLLVILPGIILGIIPAFVGMFIGNNGIFIFGLLFILGAGGDLLILWKLRNEHKDTLVLDHATKCGCIVYDRIEEEKLNSEKTPNHSLNLSLGSELKLK